MEFKVSAVIPMYKARDYIVENVDALLQQTLPELELVIVNDCSPDDSMAICREHYGNNPRVQLIDQPKNMGPGAARNRGVQAARGEYIGFVDSDDAVLPEAFEKMYRTAKEYDADVVHCTGVIFPLVKEAPANLLTIDQKDWLRFATDRYDVATETRLIPMDPMERFRNWRKEAYHWAVWNKLYRRTFLLENHLRFGDIKLSEDQLFCFGVLFNAKNYVLMPGEYYLYRLGGESLCRGSDYLPLMERALTSIFGAIPMLKETMSHIPFFAEHPECAREAMQFVIDNLEMIYLKPGFQRVGEERLLEDGRIKALFEKQFGECAEYAYYCFVEQHKQYPPADDVLNAATVESLMAARDAYLKEHPEQA